MADAGLGTINAVRSAAAPFGGVELAVALNRFDPVDALHHENQQGLNEREGFAVVTAPVQLAARLAADALRMNAQTTKDESSRRSDLGDVR